jgi:hypothetical protein
VLLSCTIPFHVVIFSRRDPKPSGRLGERGGWVSPWEPPLSMGRGQAMRAFCQP